MIPEDYESLLLLFLDKIIFVNSFRSQKNFPHDKKMIGRVRGIEIVLRGVLIKSSIPTDSNLLGLGLI